MPTVTANQRFETDVRQRVASAKLPAETAARRAAIEAELDVVYEQASQRLQRLTSILPATYRPYLTHEPEWSVLSDYCADLIDRLMRENELQPEASPTPRGSRV